MDTYRVARRRRVPRATWGVRKRGVGRGAGRRRRASGGGQAAAGKRGAFGQSVSIFGRECGRVCGVSEVVVAPGRGRILAGRYELERVLGRGGMGTVWRARHLTLDAPVAVKVLAAELFETRARRRFVAEARAAARLNSPHIVRLFDYGVDEGLAFLVMELLEGETLSGCLLREGRMSAKATAEVMRQVCRGVAKAHEAELVHRDLKPENLFLVENEGATLVKVLDFGIAKSRAPEQSAGAETGTGMLLGTLPYMSPEQIDSPRSVGYASDLWSLGVIAYCCLVGQHPFAAETVGGLVAAITHRPVPIPSAHGDVPAAFDDWIARALDRDPARRFRSARELADALDDCLGVKSESRPAAVLRSLGSTLPTQATPVIAPGLETDAPVSAGAPQSAGKATRTGMWFGIMAALGALGALVYALTRDAAEGAEADVEALIPSASTAPSASSASALPATELSERGPSVEGAASARLEGAAEASPLGAPAAGDSSGASAAPSVRSAGGAGSEAGAATGAVGPNKGPETVPADRRATVPRAGANSGEGTFKPQAPLTFPEVRPQPRPDSAKRTPEKTRDPQDRPPLFL